MKPALILLAALWLSGCEVVDRPNRPVPSEFSATMLDGGLIGRGELKGHPWVVNFWLPG